MRCNPCERNIAISFGWHAVPVSLVRREPICGMNRGVYGLLRKVIKSGVWGLVSLLLVNVAAVVTGVSLGFGWLSGGVAVLLGVPGVIGLLCLNALFLIV